jgi:hypothetical protein
MNSFSPVLPSDWKPHSKIISAIMGNVPSFGQLNKKDFRALFFEPDDEYLNEAKVDVQSIFDLIEARAVEDSSSFHIITELFVIRMLALLPFLQPHGLKVRFPIMLEGKRVFATYTFDKKIPLSSFNPIDPLVAYGLKPEDKKHPPILLFKGTTYPADIGSLRSILADMAPFQSVGGRNISMKPAALVDWLESNPGSIVAGISLGGGLAQHTGRIFPHKVSKVYAIAAPRLMFYESMPSKYPTSVRVETEGDVVSLTGTDVPPGTTTYRFTLNKDLNAFVTHLVAPEVQYSKVEIIENAEKEKLSFKAKALTCLHQVVGPFLWILILVLAALYIIYKGIAYVPKTIYKSVSCL